MVRTLVLAALLGTTLSAATLSTDAVAQPRWHHHGWRRCHWVWHRGRHVRVCRRW